MIRYFMPSKIYFGNGAMSALDTVELPGKKAMIVTGGTSIKKFGYLDKLCASLKKQGVSYVIFDKILPNPIVEHVMECAALVKKEGCDFLIGIGGGSSMDSAKSIAVMATNEGHYWDYISRGSGKGLKRKNKALPMVAITTTAGTGTEADPWTVITCGEEKIGYGSDDTFPVLSIVDPLLTKTVPPHLTAYQGFDALFHSTEGYINKTANHFSDMFCLKAIELIGKGLARAVKNGNDEDARELVSLANTISGMVESSSGCTSCHALEHALSAVYPKVEHGAGLIMVSVEYYKYFVSNGACPERFIDMAKALGKTDATSPDDFIIALQKLISDCNVDSLQMSCYGVQESDLQKLTDIAYKTMGNLFDVDPIPLDPQNTLKIYQKSYK